MKLKRLRIENFKRFRLPLELRDFTDGLNLFVAPNEAGKSTVAEAIRAAFFERYKSSSVSSLRPWNDSSATPSVEVEFELGGKPARLSKAFLGKKRCQLSIDGRDLDGTEAEDHLGQLLGFSFAGRGGSSPEHMGIPGLLWIKQGTSHELAKAVGFASDHLRNALGDSLDELAATNGDDVIKAVETERNQLLTPSTEAPRGAYAEALRRRSELQEELEVLRAEIDAYRTAVDRLATLRRDHGRDGEARPWLALREQHAQAQAKLDDATGLADRLAAHELLLKQATTQVVAVRQQLQLMERDEEALTLREANLEEAQGKLFKAQGLLQAWEPRHTEATLASTKARERLVAARQVAAWQAQEKSVADLTTQVQALQRSHSQAQLKQEELTQLQAEALSLALPSIELKRLREGTDRLRTAQAKLDAVSTALEFELESGAKVRVAGAEVKGAERLTVVARTGIDIEGVGRITVLPGGEDLQSLIGDRDRQRDELAVLLQSLGVANLAAAEARERLHAQRVAETKAATSVLAAHAPKGLAALDADVAALSTKLTEARQTLEALALAVGAETASVPVSQAESDESLARTTLDDASAQLNEAKLAVSEAKALVSAAQDELAAARATLSDPLRADKKATASHALTDALAHETTARADVDALAEQLRTLNVSVLQQDVERFERSAKQLEAAHGQRAGEIIRLEAELEAKGALGLEEVAADKQRELDQVGRRCTELERRAKALSHLLKLLTEKRSALARRLRAPLQRHLNHYLQILFPGSSIEVSEDLSPGRITRVGTNGAETGEFEELSVGAREQMGVVARLAYADLLREAGKPTLLILDDALVHTDKERLDQMKRVLYDAASRHQILVFSCHPRAWQDLGVAARELSQGANPGAGSVGGAASQ
ncbi:AAA family ATPase [Delftia sp. SD018]|uniref:AAA family ATPase n=1 Tax=unclassified Delftia TaxID=2613839 RepID=UPI001A965974|nr:MULTISPECIES: AAA family ATPase [unclassified Delftia]MBO0990021.1 AAA family ATPase [Delftia sp. SD083]MBO1036234.1 AAA family ATPase [Delftia sp. SD018]